MPLSFSEMLALILVVGMLGVSALHLSRDDGRDMTGKLVQMGRSKPTEELVRFIRLAD